MKTNTKRAGMLLTLKCGGIWTFQRKCEKGIVEDDLCPRCGLVQESLDHCLYGCPCNDLLQDPDVQETDYSLSEPLIAQYECLRLRSLVPLCALPAVTAPANVLRLKVLRPSRCCRETMTIAELLLFPPH